MKNIFKMLPFFIVEWLGKKYGEKTNINGFGKKTKEVTSLIQFENQ